MAKKKISKKTIRQARSERSESHVGILDRFKWGESYTSLLLGIIVVVIATILVISLVRNRNRVEVPQATNQETATQELDKPLEEVTDADLPTTYVVAAGDDLWSIADKVYKSGYNWVDIAKANNLTDPGTIEVGTKLAIPKLNTVIAQEVTPTQVPAENVMSDENVDQSTQSTKGEQTSPVAPQPSADKISGDSYTIRRGDYLWEIAVRAYGDGYKWVEIARINNLTNPNLIHAENVLKLPR